MPSEPNSCVVYCQGAFGTTTGKTAHGLVRRSRRYRVAAVIDSTQAGNDAGAVLDDKPNDIPIVANLPTAMRLAPDISHFVIGLAPDGGRLDGPALETVKEAIALGLNVDSGMHDFLSENSELARLAEQRGVRIHDVRKPPDRSQLHFFSGKIADVTALKIAVLGTDSAVGKRTTAWALVDGLIAAGVATEMVGTGQTAWLQGAKYSIALDSLINDFVAGELEHAVWSAWKETNCEAIVIEGQGSLMHPAYPGGFEILAACRPDVVVMQHAPARTEYDGFPGHPLAPLAKQIAAVELVSGKPVVGVTINHEGLGDNEIVAACVEIAAETGLPVCDVLKHGPAAIVKAILKHRR